MNRALSLFALLAVCAAAALPSTVFAAEDRLGAVTSATSAPATYTATAGASLSIQCTGPIRYAAGSAASPPTATPTDVLLPFVPGSPSLPLQLGTSQDRISVLGANDFLPAHQRRGAGFDCQVFSKTPAAPSVSLVTKCTVLPQTVVAVGLTAVVVPASPQSMRSWVEICVSAENAGFPKVKCLVDAEAGKPAMGAAEAGRVLQVGANPCATFPVDHSHPVTCISDTAATGVETAECYIP